MSRAYVVKALGRVVCSAVAASLGALAIASPAVAEPSGIFEVFKQCPTGVPGVSLCVFGRVAGGEFVIGGVRVPIDRTLTLQTGFTPTGNPEDEREFFGVPAKDDEGLSKTELKLPGELLGTSVTATPELVASAKEQIVFNETALAEEEGTGLTLPIRFHLNNPLLGGSCYIGSESNPVQLRLTDGATHPPKGFKSLHGIKGKVKTLEENEEATLRLTGASLVDNTFSMPGAEGCGESPSKGSRDGQVDDELKIPSKAGENAAVLDAELALAPSNSVLASERWTVAPVFALPAPSGLPASNVTQVTATLNGTLNPGGAPDGYHFEYGTTTAYGSFEPIPENYTPSTSETLTVSQSIAGLQAGTTYHYRVVADNPEGLRVVGPDETFTTLPAPAPTVETGGTSDAGVLTATPSSGLTPTAVTPSASSSTPPAQHTLNARRRVKKHKRVKQHKSTKKHTMHTANTNARARKKHDAPRTAELEPYPSA